MGYTPKHAKPATLDPTPKPARTLLSITGTSTGRHTTAAVRQETSPAATVTSKPTQAAA